MTITVEDLTPTTDEWTIDDLDRFPPFIRAEVRHGKLVIMTPVRLWHQDVESRIRNLLVAAGQHAFTQVGILRDKTDGRVVDIGVFRAEPDNLDAAWHAPETLALVVEVWSPSSDEKDRNFAWYADLGIPRYWLAEPIKGRKRDALVTMYDLARTSAGDAGYLQTRRVSLAQLERDGLE